MALFNLQKWSDKATKEIKLLKKPLYVAKCDDFVPEDSDKLGWVHFSRITSKDNKPKANEAVYVPGNEDRYFPVHSLVKETKDSKKKEKKFIFTYKAGWAKTDLGYVIVAKVRKWLILLLALLAVLLFFFLLWHNTGMNPKDVLDFTTNQGQKSNKNNQPVIEYSSYGSAPQDVTWKAGRRDQKITLFLPKYTYLKDVNGKGKSYKSKNNIDAAAHIYVDLNKDGKFSNKECVYNPVSYDKNGNISGIKHMLKPGYQINAVVINRDIPKGKYNAKVLWTGITEKTHELANPVSFTFKLTVK